MLKSQIIIIGQDVDIRSKNFLMMNYDVECFHGYYINDFSCICVECCYVFNTQSGKCHVRSYCCEMVVYIHGTSSPIYNTKCI
jgi:hypothetical protein